MGLSSLSLLLSSARPTKENADCRPAAIGIKNGLGHGEFMQRPLEDVVRIGGTLSKTDFVHDGVLGSLVIGLKKIISVFRESGDEQSLDVSDDELSWFCSDPIGLDTLDDGVVDPELFVIFEKNVMLRFRADLKILLYLAGPASLAFAEETVSLQEPDTETLSKNS